MTDRVWLKQYTPGVPSDIDPSRYSSLKDVLEQSCKNFAALPAYSCMGKTLSFADIDRLSRNFAAYLQHELKLEKGDRVAIMMPNLLQYPVAAYGVLRAGMTVVNTNPLYTPRELLHQLEDSGAKAIVILENFAHTLEGVMRDTKIEKVITTQVGDLLSFPKGMLINFVLKRIKKMVPRWNINDTLDFSAAIALGAKHKLDDFHVTHDDIAFLQYTGGTTGVAKGAMLTHRNMISNFMQAEVWLASRNEIGKEKIITALPLYHIFSLTANCLVYSSIGGENILITNPRDFKGFVKELNRKPFTAITGVNTLFNALLNTEDFKNVDFSKLKITLGGGMAVQRAVAEKWQEVTGKPLLEAYGLTETSPAACINPLDTKGFNGSIGVPISSTYVEILDDDDHELAVGEVGELCIKGPQVMKGYWNRPEETAKTMTPGGALRTGDMGYMDQQGFFYITDRKKDMILVSGFNVYPNEVEDVAVTHPGVLEAAAVGIPNEKSGEMVKLFVVLTDPNVSADDIKAHCRDHLTGYKVPRQIEFREELPKTNVGKILRRELRDEAIKQG